MEVRDDGVWVSVPPHVRTVTDLMVETMVAWGVTHVFGMVGHSNLGLADAIRRQVETGSLTYIGIRHEGAASFAASAFAKLTGRPAACLSIAGPGATKGKGVVSDHHPLGCGVLGRSGTPIASWFMNEADLLLVMGASFSNHTGIPPRIPRAEKGRREADDRGRGLSAASLFAARSGSATRRRWGRGARRPSGRSSA